MPVGPRPFPNCRRGLRIAAGSLKAPLALRETSGGATMTTPGGAGTPQKVVLQPPRARHTGLSYGRGSHTAGLRPYIMPVLLAALLSPVLFGRGLRCAPSRYPMHSPAPLSVVAHNTRRYEHPLFWRSWPYRDDATG
jgi:hypothetical protein